jgi:hypothetical protein
MKFLNSLKDTYNRVWLLCVMQSLFAVFGFLGESLAGRFVLNLTFVLQFSLLIVALNFHLKALRDLLNSFWSLTFALIPFYLVSLSRNIIVLDNGLSGMWYLFALACLGLAAWQISSPLYYPMIQWWEYDFRFRPDIRIWVEEGSDGHSARLTDLRRGAGCVVMFHSCAIGTVINVRTDVMGQKFEIEAEIVSRKEPILGRAYIYGVKFDTENLEQRQRLKLLTNYWNESKKSKTRTKFAAIK